MHRGSNWNVKESGRCIVQELPRLAMGAYDFSECPLCHGLRIDLRVDSRSAVIVRQGLSNSIRLTVLGTHCDNIFILSVDQTQPSDIYFMNLSIQIQLEYPDGCDEHVVSLDPKQSFPPFVAQTYLDIINILLQINFCDHFYIWVLQPSELASHGNCRIQDCMH
jgi:hypothetical protein